MAYITFGIGASGGQAESQPKGTAVIPGTRKRLAPPSTQLRRRISVFFSSKPPCSSVVSQFEIQIHSKRSRVITFRTLGSFMAKIRINKLDAARRQIDAAIRMTFAGEDPVAIHSVVAAGHRIIRDLCENRGDIEGYLQFTDWINPEYEKDFWQHLNASANYFKHADKDADHVHEMDDRTSDYMILFASKWYRDLGNSLSVEMKVFANWWIAQHPEHMKPDALAKLEKAGTINWRDLTNDIKLRSRDECLKIGKVALDRAKSPLGV